MTYDVTIRVLGDDDKADVCRIWLEGQDQSKLAVPRILRLWFMRTMRKKRDVALAKDGDIGPNGSNLLKTYGGKDDRCMFVACLGAPQVVVDGCAVEEAMDEHKPEPKSPIGSIWRMSVDETCRRHGIAIRLMAICEAWARQAGCARMGLYTINPVAADFHVKRMGYKSVDHFHAFNHAIAKLLMPPVRKYEKDIS